MSKMAKIIDQGGHDPVGNEALILMRDIYTNS